MEIELSAGLFGNRTKTMLLLLLALLEESYPRELARLLGTSVSNVIKALIALEQCGAVATVSRGGIRIVALNPRYVARDELRSLLDKLALSSPALLELASDVRRRPRRTGKGM